jgi:uncharacterized damage-inducible protein DinB
MIYATASRRAVLATAILLLSSLAPEVRGQHAPEHFAQAFLPKFNYSAERLLSLAEATPAELFSWSPGEGVMTMEHVYMHIAHYNYMYPSENMGAALPEGLDIERIESIQGKEAVLAMLKASIDYTRALADRISAEELAERTTLYGQQTQKWDVLFQLQSHLSEHMGQLIAYARMNGIVPPWSR